MGVKFIGEYSYSRQNLCLRAYFWPKYSSLRTISLKINIFFVCSLQEPILIYILKYEFEAF